jgi:hypothetical protein
MANDKDIKIGLSTVGADQAAADINKVPEALDEIPPAIDGVSDALEEQGDDFGEAAEEARKHSEQLDEIAKASRTLVAIQTVELLKKTTSALREATAEGGLLHDQLGDLGPALDTVDNGLDMMSAGLGAAVATGNPLIGVLAGIAAGLAGVGNAYKAMRKDQDAADNAEKFALEMKLKLRQAEEFHKKNISLISQVEGISMENAALTAQEESLRRLIDLREKLAGQANTAARQEVQLAKLKGGDVALAEANVIATELRGGLQTLNDKLTAAKQEAAAATSREISATKEWQLAQKEVAAGLRDLWDADTQAIKAAAENAAKEGEQSREKLTGFMATAENSRLEILRSAEIALETKEKEYEGKTSTAAKNAFDQVFRSLVTEQSRGQQNAQQAIAEITANAAAVTTAASAKAQEVNAAIQSAATNTVQAIQTLAPQPQDRAAVVQAVQGVGKAITDQGNATVTALAAVQAGISQVTSRIAAQEARINQLFARSR